MVIGFTQYYDTVHWKDLYPVEDHTIVLSEILLYMVAMITNIPYF